MQGVLTAARQGFTAAGLLLAFLAASMVVSAAESAAGNPAATLRYSKVAGAGGIPLNVVSAGDPAKPSIILVHGSGQSYLSWEQQLRPPLTDRFFVVAFDLRGHGNSGKPWNKEAYQDYRLWAGDVRAVMEAMHLDHPVLVGWSYGTGVVADYLRAYGARAVRGILLTGGYGGMTPPLRPSPPSPEPLASRMAIRRQQQLSGNIEDNIAAAATSARLLTSREMSAEYTQRAIQISMMLPGYARVGMFDRPTANEDLVAKISVPLRIIVGSKDPNTPEQDARDLAAKVPGAMVSVYAESGHSPFVEEAERFTGELAEFAVSAGSARAATSPKPPAPPAVTVARTGR